MLTVEMLSVGWLNSAPILPDLAGIEMSGVHIKIPHKKSFHPSTNCMPCETLVIFVLQVIFQAMENH